MKGILISALICVVFLQGCVSLQVSVVSFGNQLGIAVEGSTMLISVARSSMDTTNAVTFSIAFNDSLATVDNNMQQIDAGATSENVQVTFTNDNFYTTTHHDLRITVSTAAMGEPAASLGLTIREISTKKMVVSFDQYTIGPLETVNGVITKNYNESDTFRLYMSASDTRPLHLYFDASDTPFNWQLSTTRHPVVLRAYNPQCYDPAPYAIKIFASTNMGPTQGTADVTFVPTSQPVFTASLGTGAPSTLLPGGSTWLKMSKNTIEALDVSLSSNLARVVVPATVTVPSTGGECVLSGLGVVSVSVTDDATVDNETATITITATYDAGHTWTYTVDLLILASSTPVVDYCMQSPCGANAACFNGVSSRACTCNEGYNGDATTACTQINLCVNSNGGCDTSATCAAAGPAARTCTCNSGYNGNGFACIPVTCTDETKNGLETDVDCGGGSCARCGAGRTCNVGQDCISLLCSNHQCEAPALCVDSVQDRFETDVDCGGSECLSCATGQGCSTNSDCFGKNCVSGKCEVAPSGNPCKASTDCASSQCLSFVCTETSGSSSSNDGKIIGGVIGALVGFILLALLIAYLINRYYRRTVNEPVPTEEQVVERQKTKRTLALQRGKSRNAL